MANHSPMNQLKVITPAETGFDDVFHLQNAPAIRDSEVGTFEASLHYAAADLDELALSAPEAKRESLMAVVRLLRSLADS